MENLNITPEGMLLSGAVYTGFGIGAGIKYAIKKSKTTLNALIMGSGSGKTELVKTFNDLYKDEKYYFLDLEGLFENDAKVPPPVKDELKRLKQTDCILYTARVLKFYRALLTDILPTLKRLNKIIVVVLSNRNIAKFLKIRNRIYLTSDRKLFKEQLDKSEFKEYLQYCRSALKPAKTILYRDYDDLLTKVQETFGIIDKL